MLKLPGLETTWPGTAMPRQQSTGGLFIGNTMPWDEAMMPQQIYNAMSSCGMEMGQTMPWMGQLQVEMA